MDNLTLIIFHAYYNTADKRRLEQLTQMKGFEKAEKEVLVTLIIEGFITMTITFFGFFGNLLSAWMLSRPRMRESPINSLFLGLAFADTVIIIAFGLTVGIPAISTFYGVNFSGYEAVIMMLPYNYAIAFTALTSSTYLILTITIERYLAVCHPFRSTILYSWLRASCATVAVFILSILVNLPRWWEFSYVSQWDMITKSGKLVYLPVTTELRKNTTYDRFILIYYVLLNFLLPMLAISILNFLIFREIRSAKEFRKVILAATENNANSSQLNNNNENSLSKILLMIVLVFLICNSLFLVNIIARFITGSTSVFVIDQLRNSLWTVNSSVNFLIYYAYSKKFRKEFITCWNSFKGLFYKHKDEISE